MKTKIISIVVMLLMACNVMAQDYMRVYFKDRSCRKFYLNDITSIATKKLDADGIQHSDYEYQHITTHHNKYVYNLNEVDSITFSKFKEEEVINNMSVTLPEIFEVISSCSNVNDINNYLSKIKNYQGVEDAWVSGVELFVTFKGWETMSFTFPHNSDSEEDEEDLARESNRAKAMIPRMEAIVKPEGKELKAVIANQQAFDESRQKFIIGYYVPLQLQFESCGIKTDNKTRPRLSFFAKDIFNYDLIFLVTHGTYDIKIHSHELLTGDELCVIPKKGKGDELAKIEKEKELLDSLFAKRKPYEATDEHIRTGWIPEVRDGDSCWVCYVSITEKFIEEKADGHFENPHSIMFNTACSSLYMDYSLAYIYLAKGLGVYLGYNNINTVGKKAGPKMYELMLSGLSFNLAQDSLPMQYKMEYRIEDKRYTYLNVVRNDVFPRFGGVFLFETCSKQIDQKELEMRYLNDQTVVFEGVTTTIQPNAVTCGFNYGYLGRGKRYNWDINTINSNIETERLSNRNLIFRAELKDLSFFETIYFCAYTYDGRYYNYSKDTVFFTLPLFTCPDDKHPHAIDLGLPSGTKWACCNVDTSHPEKQSPTNYGGYYAWGETEEKSYYYWDTYPYHTPNGYIYIGDDIAGTKYDVAHVKWGGSWRMPSHDQQMELLDNCSWTWTTRNGVHGILVTHSNFNTIFLPAAGYYVRANCNDEDRFGHYWSSSLGETTINEHGLLRTMTVYSLMVLPSGLEVRGNHEGWAGLSVRPVCP